MADKFQTIRYIKNQFGNDVVSILFDVNLEDRENRHMMVAFAFRNLKDFPNRAEARKILKERITYPHHNKYTMRIWYEDNVPLVKQVFRKLLLNEYVDRHIIKELKKYNILVRI